MKKITTILLTTLLFSFSASAQWTTIITDETGDAGGKLDGTLLEYKYDLSTDEISFRITCTNLATYSASPSADFNFVLPNGLASGNSPKNHWTTSTATHVSAYVYADVTGSAPDNYTFVDFPNEIEETAGTSTRCASNCATLNVDVPANQITYTFKRKDIITDAEMGGNSAEIGLLMNLGSNQGNDDPITHVMNGPSVSTFTIAKANASLNKISKPKTITAFPNPSSSKVNFDVLTVISEIRVTDILGRTSTINHGEVINSFDVSTLSSGMYSVQLYNDKGVLIGTSKLSKF